MPPLYDALCSLFIDFIVAGNGFGFFSVGINGMVSAFPHFVSTVLYKEFD